MKKCQFFNLIDLHRCYLQVWMWIFVPWLTAPPPCIGQWGEASLTLWWSYCVPTPQSRRDKRGAGSHYYMLLSQASVNSWLFVTFKILNYSRARMCLEKFLRRGKTINQQYPLTAWLPLIEHSVCPQWRWKCNDGMTHVGHKLCSVRGDSGS
jgi:hypothetical protein